jgi:hypothetical protein
MIEKISGGLTSSAELYYREIEIYGYLGLLSGTFLENSTMNVHSQASLEFFENGAKNSTIKFSGKQCSTNGLLFFYFSHVFCTWYAPKNVS